MTPIDSLRDISDEDLLRHVAHLAQQERHATAQLIASLTELDIRKLYLREGCASLFTYCTQVLHLSEHAAYGRIEAARAQSLLGAARHQSRREVELLVARVRPKFDVSNSIRKLPEAVLVQRSPAPVTENSEIGEAQCESARPIAPARRPVVAPLAPARYKMQFTVSEETYQALRRAQDLLRHAIPNGDPAAIIARALTMLVEHLEKTKWAATARRHASRGVSPRLEAHSRGGSAGGLGAR